MLEYWICERIGVSPEGKMECLETVKTIIKMAVKARSDGILSLEDEIQSTNNMFLKKAVQLTVDGISQESIRKVLENWIISGNYRGRMFLKRILIMEGVLAIQQGANPSYIYELLASYFGEDFYPKYVEYCNYNEVVPPLER